MASTKKRNGKIDFLKFLFAIIVLIHHTRYVVGDENSLFLGGSLAVEFYFLVSGYLMMAGIQKMKERPVSLGAETGAFLLKKYKSFCPEIIISYIFAFAVTYIGGKTGFFKLLATSFSDVLLLGMTGLRIKPVNGAIWYLSSMLLAMAILYPLVRKFGKNLPEGEILARDDNSKGIVREVLGTGRHRINPYAYEVKLCDDIVIMPGNIGVVANLCGKDIFSNTTNDLKNNKGFLVGNDRKGVQQQVLKEGTHRINPYIQSVAIVNIQSQRYEFSGKDAIGFITLDGFYITLEGTVEFNISPESAPLLTQEVGNMEDIMKKLILPSVSGFARIEGSKKSATEFIVGESRQLFQNQLEEFLRKNCRNWGVSINSVLIRDINPPQEIAGIIRNREIAKQEAKKFTHQIEQAKSATELERQRMLALQRRSKVEAETSKITAEIAAKQAKLEKVIAAKTQLEAAALQLKTAQAEARAALALAESDRQVIAAGNKAEVEILKRNIAAYGGGEAYLRGKLYEKIAPNLDSVMANSQNGGVFGLPVLKNSAASDGKKQE